MKNEIKPTVKSVMAKQMKFSYFDAPIGNVIPKEAIDIQACHKIITSGELEEITKDYRSLGKDKAKEQKKSLFPYVTFSADCEERSAKSIKSHSGLLSVDFDNVINLSELIDALMTHKYFETVLYYVTPSGEGLKWIIAIDLAEFSHDEYARAVLNCIDSDLFMKADIKCKDIARASFLCHDESAYINPKYLTDKPIIINEDKELFNPSNWIKPKVENESSLFEKISIENNPELNVIEDLINQIENAEKDITTSYGDWLTIGFALTDTLGEYGRSFYHRISKFNPEYQEYKANEQYTNCINSFGDGVQIGSLYYLAEEAGFKVAYSLRSFSQKEMPTFSDNVEDKLPVLAKEFLKHTEDSSKRDMMILALLAVVGACFPKLSGQYGKFKVMSNLFLFVSGRAASGKGEMGFARNIVGPYNEMIKESGNGGFSRLFIPANNSSSGFLELLKENGEAGLIFESEADNLAQSLNSDYGGHTDKLCAAFQNEMLSFYRRGGKELIEILKPYLSIALSGTHLQINNLIRSSENGLLSRFIILYIDSKPTWEDPFSDEYDNQIDYQKFYDDLGDKFLKMVKIFNRKKMNFTFNKEQRAEFNNYFKPLADGISLNENSADNFTSSIFRLGLVTFKIAMVLSALRYMEQFEVGELEHFTVNEYNDEDLTCHNDDFNTAMTISSALLDHTVRAYNQVNRKSKPITMDKKSRFLTMLPSKFNRKEYLSIGRKLNITDKTCDRYIDESEEFRRESHGNYVKIK